MNLTLLLSASQDFSSKTLKRTRKFVIDGVEVSVTTSKIIGDDEKKDEEMRFLRYVDDRFSTAHIQYTNSDGGEIWDIYAVCISTSWLSFSSLFSFSVNESHELRSVHSLALTEVCTLISGLLDVAFTNILHHKSCSSGLQPHGI